MNDWEATCRVKKVMQRDRFGCGIACAAMVAGKSYSEAKRVFTTCGLGKTDPLPQISPSYVTAWSTLVFGRNSGAGQAGMP